MASDDYIPLPVELPVRSDLEQGERGSPKPEPPRRASGPIVLQTNDPRFSPAIPSPLKRAVLLFFVFCLFWLALRLRATTPVRVPPELEADRCFSAYTICNASRLTRRRFPTDFD